ncbi:MAG: zinc ABC transporter ATP-binding protein AztA [Hyphomicrobiaceae bacterium]
MPFWSRHVDGGKRSVERGAERIAHRSGPSIRFDNLTLGYDGHPAVHHLSGVIRPGSLTALVGPNGSGKSTLLKALVGEVRPIEGRIEFDCATNSRSAAGRIAYLPQQAVIDRSFPITVQDLVSLGLWNVIGAWNAPDRRDRERVAHALSAVGLEGFETRSIDRLSGGQLQRALFARVLVQDAELILLDEPFNAIDARTSEDLLRLIESWRQEHRTVVAVLHDLDLARERFPEALLLARRPVAWGAAPDVLTPANLLVARRMAEHWDDSAPVCSGDDRVMVAPTDVVIEGGLRRTTPKDAPSQGPRRAA